MATSLLRIGCLSHVKCLHAGSWIALSRAPAAGAPAAFSTKSGGSKKPTKSPSADKKQPKTYFDLEKLIQHKSCKLPKTEVSSAVSSAAAVNTSTTPAPESKPITSDVTTAASALEATRSASTISEPDLAAEAVESVSESALEGKATFEAEVIAEPIQMIQSSEPIVEVAPVAEATTKIVAEVEDIGGPSAEAAASTTDTTASDARLTSAGVSAEAVPELLSNATPFEDVQKTTVEPALTEVSLESVRDAAPVEVAPFESIAEAVFVESTLKSMAEDAPKPLAEAASPEAILDFEVEASSVKSTLEHLAEAAPVEPTLESVAETAPVGVALESLVEVAPADVTLEPLVQAVPVDMSLESLLEAAPVDVTLEPLLEAAPVDVTLEPLLEAAPVDVPLESPADAAPADVTLEPLVQAAPVGVTLEPVVEAAMETVPKTNSVEPTLEPMLESAATLSEATLLKATPEPVVEVSPAELNSEPVDEASTASDAETAPMESAPELWTKASEAADEISVTKESSTIVDPALVLPEAAGEELPMEATAEPVEPSEALLDPVQKLFLDSIRQYSTKSQAAGGLVDADADYQKALAQEVAKLQRLYGGGDLTSFPEFKFTEPQLDEGSLK